MNDKQIKNGFTLIEVLIAVVLMGVLAVALLSLQFVISQNQISVWQNYVSIDEANTSAAMLVRELRTARYGDNGAYILESAADNEVVFYSDTDFDGDTEKVRYFLNGTDFTKGIIEPVGYPATYPSDQEKIRVLSENVRNDISTPILYYYNEDWPEDIASNPLSTPASVGEISMIKIYLVVNTSINQPDKDYILESFAQVRMTKENL